MLQRGRGVEDVVEAVESAVVMRLLKWLKDGNGVSEIRASVDELCC